MVDASFKHVLETLLGIPDTHEVYEGLKEGNITSSYDIMMLNEKHVEDFTCDLIGSKSSVIEKYKSLLTYYIAALTIVGDFLRDLKDRNNGILDEATILATTKEQWNNFRVSIPVKTTASGTTSTSSTSTYVPDETTMEIMNFTKSVKRDRNQYPEIKHIQYFENWQRSFLGVACSHNIEQVFDVTYVPQTAKEKKLFELRQILS
jgi:hypothetical protein